MNESDKFTGKLPQGLLDKVVNQEVGHRKEIMNGLRSARQKSSLMIFSTYLFCFEKINSIKENFFDYDIHQLLINFARYLKTTGVSGSYRMNIFIHLQNFFEYSKRKYASNSKDNEKLYLQDKFNGNLFLNLK